VSVLCPNASQNSSTATESEGTEVAGFLGSCVLVAVPLVG
jgi:hypothetical protein